MVKGVAILKIENVGRLSVFTMYAIFVISAGVSLVGLTRIVFYSWTPPQFYYYVFGAAVLEPIALFLLWTKNILGLRTSIKAKTYATDEEINNYMKNLISSGSTLDLVSGRLHWVSEDESVKERMIERAKTADINIYMPRENQIARELRRNGLYIHIIPSLRGDPHARFTLVDKARPGSAILAVGSGRIPTFTISEFYEDSYPQVVALARDYINRLIEEEKSA